MPSYPNVGTGVVPSSPPFAVYPGDRISLINNENFAVGTASDRCCVADVYGTDDVGVTVVIEYARFGGAPSAVQIDVQMAIVDQDNAYNTIYSSTNTAGESVNLNVQRQPFIRFKKVSQTGGGAMNAAVCR